MPSEPLALARKVNFDLARRAEPKDLPEWMDEPCSYEDFRACLHDLAQVNRLTLAYRPTLTFLKRIASAVPAGNTLHIVDVGCGGGDMLRRVERWAARRKLAVRLTGIDLNPFAARAAAEFTPGSSRIDWITGDAFTPQAVPPRVDVVLSSLFTHHLASPEIIRFVAWMEAVTRRGWFINDLCRERVPMELFGRLARVARWHRFVQHDGPVSFRRSFREEDWRRFWIAAQQSAAPRHGVARYPDGPELFTGTPQSGPETAASGTSLPALRIARWFPARLCVERYK